MLPPTPWRTAQLASERFSVLSDCRASTLSPPVFQAVTGSRSLPISRGNDWDDLGFTPLDHLTLTTNKTF